MYRVIVMEKQPCRYCFDDCYPFMMVSPCHCTGTNTDVHLYCLVRWCWVSKTSWCPVCKKDFKNKELWNVLVLLSTIAMTILDVCGFLYYLLNLTFLFNQERD